jgi:hypothetical protein
MFRKLRVLGQGVLLGATGWLILAPMAGEAAAEEREYPAVEEYIEQARPYLHLSCEGAWAETNEDEDAYIDVINKVTAIGFINHDFDIKKLDALPPPELKKVQAGYYNEIGRLCGENPRRLLAGVVEDALVRVFAKVDPDAESR